MGQKDPVKLYVSRWCRQGTCTRCLYESLMMLVLLCQRAGLKALALCFAKYFVLVCNFNVAEFIS